MNILYQCSNSYAPYAGISITSLLLNGQDMEQLNIYILDDNISQANRIKLEETVLAYNRTLTFIDTQPIISKLQKMNIPMFRGSYATYFKLFVNHYIPDSVDKILYVDSDTIVHHTLQELESFDFNGAAIGMVPCIVDNQYKLKIGLTEEYLFYNAGVIFFDMHMWRTLCCEHRLVQFMLAEAKTGKRIFFAADNEVIVLALKENITSLDLKFNLNTAYLLYTSEQMYQLYGCKEAYTISNDTIQKAIRNPTIIHYIGLQVRPPWEVGSIHPLRSIWEIYKQKSLWSDCVNIKPRTSAIIKLQRILYRILPRKIYISVHRIMAQKLVFSKYGNENK